MNPRNRDRGGLGFGVVCHVSGADGPATAFERTIRLAQVAEDAGYGSFWVAQHRFGADDAHLPAPLILLAALARETDRIGLGTASVAAALEHPRRLAEDAAVVDVLSGGRLELGLGSGSDPIASAAWGLDHDHRHVQFWEVVDELRGLLSGACDPPLHPPAPGLADRLWITAGSSETVLHAADRGLGVIAGRRRVRPGSTPAEEDLRVAALVESFADAGGGKVAVSRPVVATEESSVADWIAAEERRVRGPGAPLTIAVGTAQHIMSGLDRDPGVRRADTVLVHTRPLTVPCQVEETSLRLLAAEPALRSRWGSSAP
ncbi:MAG: LLM class flavin-dependent oxidoreductase [Dietzia sp.]